MFYGQKNYNQEMGNGKYTIAEVGCFLTSFCNLLSKVGAGQVDPPTLNEWFKAHGSYIRDPDGANEDLAWSSITAYNGNIKVSGTGTGPVPTSLPAIVKFYYQSIQNPWLDAAHTRPNMINHFCLVDHIESSNVVYIVDSYDGLVKSPAQYQAQYHAPVGWASYAIASATPPAPAPAKTLPFAPVPIPGNTANIFNLVTAVPGYRTSGLAASRSGATVTVDPGNYYVYNQFNGMVNVTKKPGTPGAWINPGDNVAPPPVNTDPGTFEVSKAIPGYMTSNEAANHTDATVTVASGHYFVFNTAHGMVNVTKVANKPGAWINPADLEAPIPAAAPAAPAPPTTAPATPTATTEGVKPPVPSWQATFKPHPETFVAMQPYTVKDLSGQKSPIKLTQYDIVPSAGTFTGPDDILYSRSPTSVKNGWWYGIPMSLLELESDVFDSNTDISTRQATHTLSLRDKIVIILAKITGWIERFKKQPAGSKGGK